jgi:hypothetical protein
MHHPLVSGTVHLLRFGRRGVRRRAHLPIHRRPEDVERNLEESEIHSRGRLWRRAEVWSPLLLMPSTLVMGMPRGTEDEKTMLSIRNLV